MTSALHYRVIESPVGPLTVAGKGSTVMHLCMSEQTHKPDKSAWQPAHNGMFDDVAEQLAAYFAGQLTQFDVDLRPIGTEFQQKVWTALQAIPYGHTRSYGEIAAMIGSPGAARAVGLANGRNPIGIIIPCHRVIGSSGDMTGYGGGIERKRMLLTLEKALQ